MKTYSFLISFALMCLAGNVCQSQVLTPDFSVNFLAGSDDEIQKSTVDGSGNLYIAGIFYSDSLIFGNDTLFKRGSNDLFLVKLDTNATVIFATSYLNSDVAKVTGLVVDALDNIYLTGFYSDSLEFDTIGLQCIVEPNTPSSSKNSFLTKINSIGEIIWAKSYAGNSQAGSLVVDINQNVYVSGILYGTMNISSIETTIHCIYPNWFFLLKVDSEGNDIWAKGYGGELMIDTDQNLFFTGTYMDSLNLENITLSTISYKENHNLFLAKADTNGHVVWAKTYCEGEHALLGGALLDTLTNTILLTGTYKTDSLSFDQYIVHNNGTADIFFAKIDLSGNALIAKSYGGDDPDYSWGLSRISSEYMAILGTSFSDSIIFGDYVVKPGSNPTHYGDFFITVIDNNGNPVWAQGFPMSSGQALQSIISDGSQSIFVVGDFCSVDSVSTRSAIFSEDPTYIDQTSLYMVRFRLGNAAVTPKVTISDGIVIYPNPSPTTLNVQVTSESNEFTMEILNLEGRRVFKKPLVPGLNTMDIGHLQKGIYLIKINSKDAQFTQKFIKGPSN